MLDDRNLKLDLLALAILAVTIFLVAALVSYDPADPACKLVFPERAEYANACGRSGAVIGSLLFHGIGLGAYYLVFSLAVLDALLLTRKPIVDPLLRLFGWLLSLAGFTALVAMAVPWLSPGPVIGAGGYLGASIRALLQTHFASVGSYILATSLVVGGLLLSTDYVLLKITAWLVGKPAKSLGRGVVNVSTAYAGRLGVKIASRRRTDIDEIPGAEEAVAVKISGRPTVEEEADEEELAEDEEASVEETAEAESEEAGEDEPAPAQPVKRGLAGLLFRKPKSEQKREEVIEELDAATLTVDDTEYELPSIDLLLQGEPFCYDEQEKDVRRKAKILEKTFADFGFNIRVVEIQTGPVIAQFEVELEAGLRLSKITGLADDLAIALRVPSVRIVAPIPGKNTVGIEVPNNERQLVRLREVIEEANGKAQKMRIPLFLGKDVAGNPLLVDLTTLPHLLIAGRTGTGKSVCLNTIIVSMLMTRRPDEVRMLMIDPKMVELSPYKSLPHLMHPVVTDMRKAEAILGWAVEKMEERYSLLARAGVRHVSAYNQLGEEELMERIQPENEEERKAIPLQMPYIVVVADEMADLMMTAAKEVEQHIIRLAQKSRAVGIHLVLATQKPTVDVITGLIKSNLPARISFQVASRTDSRVVLDEMGADKLLGNGDMLFLWPGTSTLIRGQGTYLSDDEINHVIGAVATTEPQFVKELVQLKTSDAASSGESQTLNARDELYEAAIDVVVREGRGSVSLLQRALGIGYGRAARLIDFMAEDGIVGQYNGSQAREVLLSVEDWEARTGRKGGVPAVEPAAPAPRRGTITLPPPEPADERPAPRAAKPTLRAEPIDEEMADESAEDERWDDAPPESESNDALGDDKEEDVEFNSAEDYTDDEVESDDVADADGIEDVDETPPPTRRGRYKAESA